MSRGSGAAYQGVHTGARRAPHGNAKAFTAKSASASVGPILGLRECIAALMPEASENTVDRATARARTAFSYADSAMFNVKGVGVISVFKCDEATAERLHEEYHAAARGGAQTDDARKHTYRARLRIFDMRGDEALNSDGLYARTEQEAAHLISGEGLLETLRAASLKAASIHSRHGFTAPPECWADEELARRVPHIRSQLSRTPEGTSVVFPMRGGKYGPNDDSLWFRAYLDFGPHIDALHESGNMNAGELMRSKFKRREIKGA